MIRAVLFAIAAVTCDVFTTYVIVEVLGGTELNPIMYRLTQLGWIKFTIIKYALGVGLPPVAKLIRPNKVDLLKLMYISAWLHFIISCINAISLVIWLSVEEL